MGVECTMESGILLLPLSARRAHRYSHAYPVGGVFIILLWKTYRDQKRIHPSLFCMAYNRHLLKRLYCGLQLETPSHFYYNASISLLSTGPNSKAASINADFSA